MPLGDKKGPNGEGQMTGRKQGYCVGNDHPGYQSDMQGRGMGRGTGAGIGRGLGRKNRNGIEAGRGLGRGLGRRSGFKSIYDNDSDAELRRDEEIDSLNRENEKLRTQLKEVEKKIDDLKNKS